MRVVGSTLEIRRGIYDDDVGEGGMERNACGVVLYCHSSSALFVEFVVCLFIIVIIAVACLLRFSPLSTHTHSLSRGLLCDEFKLLVKGVEGVSQRGRRD